MKRFLLIALSLPIALILAGIPLACSGGGNNPDGGDDGCTLADGCDQPEDDGPISCTAIGQCPSGHLCIGGLCQEGTPCTGPDTDECPQNYTCNVMQAVCVPESVCGSDADCAALAETPHCLVTDGVCVACTTQAHCGDPADVFCNDLFQCEPVGPDCTSDGDCTGGQHCDMAQGKCVDCTDSSHCAPDVCLVQTHTCVECLTNNDCVAPLAQCLVANHTCVECYDDGHCSGTERCNQSSHSCTDLVCTSNADCVAQPGPYCHVGSGDCVACLDSSHCGGLFCRELSCQVGCVNNLECEQKLGAGYRCDGDATAPGDCFFAECLSDADCSGSADGEHCKLAASPSQPPQYTCVPCTEDGHCDEFFTCKIYDGFVCAPMPCYLYDEPDATCAQADPCYVCDMGAGATSGQCVPRYDCSTQTCCQGYSCNSMSHCERNLNCATNADCAVDSICNPQTAQCEYQSCCEPGCNTGYFCNEQDCECEQGQCKMIMETCNATIQNCCEGLICNAFMGICFSL